MTVACLAVRDQDLGNLAADPDAGIEGRCRILRHEADLIAAQSVELGATQPKPVLALEQDAASVPPARRVVITEQLHGYGRVAAAGLAYEAERLTTIEGEADARQDRLPTRLLAIRQGEILDLHQGNGFVHRAPSRTDRPRMRATPSVNRLRPTTREASAKPGPRTVIGETMRRARFSLIIRPHSGVGGRMPKPRKPSEPISTGA